MSTLDERIMKCLEALAGVEALTQSSANEVIDSHFADREYLEGSTTKVRVYISRFVPWAMTVLDESKLEKSFRLLNVIYKELYPSKGSLDTILPMHVRKPIQIRFGQSSEYYKMVKNMVRISYEEKGEILRKQKDNLYESFSNRKQFKTKEIMRVLEENSESTDPMRRAICLLISSGSRPIELFARSEYKPINKQWITQQYVAKKRDNEPVEIKKPLIGYDSERFIKHLSEVRTELTKEYGTLVQENGQLSTTINLRANKTIREIFGKDLTLYTARKIYGSISYDLYSKTTTIFGENPSQLIWLNCVLGHSKTSLQIAMNYSTIEVT